MKKTYLYILIGGVLLAGAWYLFKDKFGLSGTAAKGATKVSSKVNTGTATSPATVATTSSGAASNWATVTNKTLSNAATTAKTALTDADSIKQNVTSLFGGFSNATGKQSATTSGSGAGVPVDDEADDGSDDTETESAYDGSDSFDGYGDE